MKSRSHIITICATITAGLLLSPPSAMSKLRMSADGIPVFDITTAKVVKGKKTNFRVKDIPKLNVPIESSIKPRSLIDLSKIQAIQVNLKDPKFSKPIDEVMIRPELQRLVQPISESKSYQSLNAAQSADQSYINLKSQIIKPAQIKNDQTKSEIKFANMTPEEILLTQGLIYLEIHQDYEMALGLFAELAAKPEYKELGDYYLADIAWGLDLPSEHRHRMVSILGSSQFKSEALTSLIENAQPGDLKTTRTVLPYLPKSYVESPQFAINVARVHMEDKELSDAIEVLKKIPNDSPTYVNAQYLLGISFYRLGNTQEAIKILESLKSFSSTVKVSEVNAQAFLSLQSLLSMTLARLKFQTGDYKKSIEYYLQVDKKYPDWLSAMTEMAWAQVLNKNFEGAAGNMFPLHTEFFRKMYAPDSYTARTVAYLNLCQYGDAKKVLADFKTKYKPFSEQVSLAQKNLTNPEQYYQLVQDWANNPKPGLINQVPSEFIAHIVRHPNFQEEQNRINEVEDQIVTLNKVALSILAKEKQLKEEQAKLNNKSEDFALNNEVYKMKSQIVGKSRRAFTQFRKEALSRFETEKSEHKVLAGKALQSRYMEVQRKTLESLDQVDVLEYELFSGAGEHLRYQMAGGKIDPKVKVDKDKDKKMNWDFTGELWEDEIGHFQSSLKNVCLPEDQ